MTPFLAPGATFALGPVSAGTHTLGVQGEGTVGGCNSGTLAGWGGSIAITVSSASASAVPSPGLVATAIAFLLGAFTYLRRRRA